MNKLHSLVLAITLLVGSVSVATAQDYDKGLEAAQAGDFQTALQEWRPLAEQGDADAQKDLGVMYFTGQGVTQDYDEAVKLYRLAAEQGNVAAQSNLAEMYYKGQGVPQDFDEAAKWLHLVAKDGSAPAQYMMGLTYEAGLVTVMFRSLNSFMRPFAQMPRGFCRPAMNGGGADCRTH
ncbi:sel1 repeat family protein [bacterium]|nr:sel1 repeat family protein [bacterium]